MSFSEVYMEQQQNTDAQENPYEVIVSNRRLYEQQDFVVETNHLLRRRSAAKATPV